MGYNDDEHYRRRQDEQARWQRQQDDNARAQQHREDLQRNADQLKQDLWARHDRERAEQDRVFEESQRQKNRRRGGPTHADDSRPHHTTHSAGHPWTPQTNPHDSTPSAAPSYHYSASDNSYADTTEWVSATASDYLFVAILGALGGMAFALYRYFT